MRTLSLKQMGSQPAEGVCFVRLNDATIELLRTEILACPFCGKGVLSLVEIEKIFDDVGGGGKKEVGKSFKYGCTECAALFGYTKIWLHID